MLTVSMSLVSLLVVFYYQTEKELFNEFQRQTSELSKAVRIGLEGASVKNINDAKSLEKYLSSLNPKGIKEISVISSTDRILASTSREHVGKWISERRKEMIFKAQLGEPVTGEGENYNVVIPVVSGQATVGYIHLTLNAEDFSAFLRLGVLRRTIAALVILALGTVMAVILAGRYSRPIEKMAIAAEKVAGGDLEQTLTAERKDEIGALSRSFNHMVQRLRQDRDLRERLRTAEHLAGIGQVARSVAHEIKNPLNFISLSIDHMGETYRPADPEQAARFESMVRNIKGEVLRIGRFAESFLEYGRPIELKRQLTSFEAIVDSVMELVEARAVLEKIVLRKEYAGLPELELDPEFIRTCLYNLVINAFDAMPEGGELLVNGENRAGWVSLAFADSGMGVEPELADKLFEAYMSSKPKGLGLGLALTRKIIEEHGGRIEYQPRPGGGSIFTIHLPVDEGRRA
jgi:nitrogen fixation/metabolism regulation signal transduction histidine kinase